MFEFDRLSLTFSDGTNLALKPGQVLFITGPNGAGKTAALQDIHLHLRQPHTTYKVVHSVETRREAGPGEYHDWLLSNFDSKRIGRDVVFSSFGSNVSDREDNWKNALPPEMSPFYSHYLSTEHRLQVARGSESISSTDFPATYIHMLQRNEALLSRISQIVRQAFGFDLIINWVGGKRVWFHVGKEPERNIASDRVSPAYLTALESLPRLDDEGDGVRSFVGALLATMCGNQPVLLIDEPEAFLHPPQARRLGSVLARTGAQRHRLIIVATHSADVMQGALDVSDQVSVCRLVRQGDVNCTSELPSDRLKALWTRPLLRSSAAVNGLFHDGVVVCEADADCRVYEATFSRLEQEDASETTPVDLFFTHGPGKGSLTDLAGTYAAVSTPVAVIADLDLMRAQGEFKKAFEALGGDWSDIADEYRYIRDIFNGQKPVASASVVAADLEGVATEIRRADKVSHEHQSRLREIIDESADWSEVKKHGLRALNGENYTRGEKLLSSCSSVGLFLVPLGELEQWWKPGSSSDKGKWFAKVIERVAVEPPDPSLDELRDFMRQVRAYFS